MNAETGDRRCAEEGQAWKSNGAGVTGQLLEGDRLAQHIARGVQPGQRVGVVVDQREHEVPRQRDLAGRSRGGWGRAELCAKCHNDNADQESSEDGLDDRTSDAERTT